MNHCVVARLHIVEMLEDFLAANRTVLISRIIDEKGHPEYDASISGAARWFGTASTLEGCIERLTDHPRKKVCLRTDCFYKGEATHLDCFGADADSADGHAGVCHRCEAKRIGGLGKKRKRSGLVASHQD
jgi:hypothetical protein